LLRTTVSANYGSVRSPAFTGWGNEATSRQQDGLPAVLSRCGTILVVESAVGGGAATGPRLPGPQWEKPSGECRPTDPHGRNPSSEPRTGRKPGPSPRSVILTITGGRQAKGRLGLSPMIPNRRRAGAGVPPGSGLAVSPGSSRGSVPRHARSSPAGKKGRHRLAFYTLRSGSTFRCASCTAPTEGGRRGRLPLR
jgi:hypothetical protein